MSHEPTIVLVHGAFADASSWNGVVERLLQRGHHVVAPANPLRGVAADSAYIASYIGQIDGPTILVGHSYGGAVFSNAACEHRVITGGIGHNLPQEAPQAFAQAILDVDLMSGE